MKIIFVLSLLIGFSGYSQDTLIWKNKSRSVVTITDMYEDTLFYTQLSDKKPKHCHLSKLNAILYKDGSKRNFEGLYMDTMPEVLIVEIPIIEPPGRDTALYNKGIRDAKKHYTMMSFWFPQRKWKPYEENILWKYYLAPSELDIEFPDKELEIKSEYRAGYVYQWKILRRKYLRNSVVIFVVAATIVAATIVF